MSQTPPAQPVTPRPAATMLLLRDNPKGIETFMVVRHDNMDFMGGQMVFPGGKVEFHDEDATLRPYCRGATGLDDTAFGLRIAAIRETFEESGLLLAYARGADQFLPHERLRDLARHYARKVNAGEATLHDIVEHENLDLATDRVVPFAHWITPAVRSKRFDVHFFIAPAPDAHALAVHDGHESVDSEWVTCEAAFDAMRQGRRIVPFPTQANLARLNKSKTMAEAIALAHRTPIVTVQPYFENGVRKLPEGSGYDHVEIFPPKKDAAAAPSPGR